MSDYCDARYGRFILFRFKLNLVKFQKKKNVRNNKENPHLQCVKPIQYDRI